MGESLWVGQWADAAPGTGLAPPATKALRLVGDPAFIDPSLVNGTALRGGPPLGVSGVNGAPANGTLTNGSSANGSSANGSSANGATIPMAAAPPAVDGLWCASRVDVGGPDAVGTADLWVEPGSVPGTLWSGPISLPSLASVGRMAVRTVLGARHLAGDPRVTGVLRAAPSVASFIARSRARSATAPMDDSVVPVRATPGLALQAYLDEILIAVLKHPDLLPKDPDYASASVDVSLLRALFAERGWLEHPAAYHRDPPPPSHVDIRTEHRAGMQYEHASFESGWVPEIFEPGRDRWLAHKANRTVHTWVARDSGARNRSWLVCAHGLGMGSNPSVDLRAFRAAQLVRRGINVAIPVLPLHGPRASGRGRGEDLMTIDMVDSLHGVAQAAWDVRRVIRWVREEYGAEQVGVMGYSLGGLVASIVASVEDDLSCVIAGIPVVDLPHLFRRHSPPHIARLADVHGVLGPVADEVHRVASPLSMGCKVPYDRRFIFAGLADRMSTFGHARRLWLHWGRPALATYAGGHVGFYWSTTVRRFVDDALARSYTTSTAAA